MIRPKDFGPSFVLETKRTVVDETTFRKLFRTTFSPWIFGTPHEDLQWQQLRTLGVVIQDFDKGVFERSGEIRVHVAVPCFVRQPPLTAVSELYDSLPNQEDFRYVVVQLAKPRAGAKVLDLAPKGKLTAEIQWGRREAFSDLIKEWIHELGGHFVWGDGEFADLKRRDGEDSRLRVWGYNFYATQLADRIGRDRFATLAEGGAWTVEEFEGGVLLQGKPDPFAVSAAEKASAAKTLGLREQLVPVLPPRLQPPNSDPRQPPPMGVVE